MVGATAPGARQRSGFLDQIRAVLIGLVVARHASISYNPIEPSVPYNIDSAGPWLTAGLTWFIAVNQCILHGHVFSALRVFHPAPGHANGAPPHSCANASFASAFLSSSTGWRWIAEST